MKDGTRGSERMDGAQGAQGGRGGLSDGARAGALTALSSPPRAGPSAGQSAQEPRPEH